MSIHLLFHDCWVAVPRHRLAFMRVLTGTLANRIRAVVTRWRQRRALEELDDRMLRDIGVSRSQALMEARKPFWRQ